MVSMIMLIMNLLMMLPGPTGRGVSTEPATSKEERVSGSFLVLFEVFLHLFLSLSGKLKNIFGNEYMGV